MPKRTYDSAWRQAQARQTREALLDAARHRFLTEGFAATTIAVIASDVGVSVDTIYKAFGGKPGLVRAICAHALAGEGSVPAGDPLRRPSRQRDRPPGHHPRLGRSDQRSRTPHRADPAPHSRCRHSRSRYGRAASRHGPPAPRTHDPQRPQASQRWPSAPTASPLNTPGEIMWTYSSPSSTSCSC